MLVLADRASPLTAAFGSRAAISSDPVENGCHGVENGRSASEASNRKREGCSICEVGSH